MLEQSAQLIEFRFRQGGFTAQGSDRYRVIFANVATDKRACEITEGDIIGGRGLVREVRVLRGGE